MPTVTKEVCQQLSSRRNGENNNPFYELDHFLQSRVNLNNDKEMKRIIKNKTIELINEINNNNNIPKHNNALNILVFILINKLYHSEGTAGGKSQTRRRRVRRRKTNKKKTRKAKKKATKKKRKGNKKRKTRAKTRRKH